MHMKINHMFILTYRVLKITENCQIKMQMNFLQEPGLRYQKIKKDLKILFYGNHLQKMNPDGTLLGEEVDQVGIQNVQQCQKNFLEIHLIFMEVDVIYYFHTTKMKQLSQDVQMKINHYQIIGYTMVLLQFQMRKWQSLKEMFLK